VDDAVRADAVADPIRTGARPGTPGVRAHQAGSEFGGHLGHRGIIAAPAVIDQVCAGPAGEPGYLRTPGVDADQLVGEGLAQPLDERHHAGDFGLRVDALPRARLDAAHIDHGGALADEATRGRSGRIVGEVRAAIVERVRGAVDDRHDQWAIAADPATAQGGLPLYIVPAALNGRSPASSVAV